MKRRKAIPLSQTRVWYIIALQPWDVDCHYPTLISVHLSLADAERAEQEERRRLKRPPDMLIEEISGQGILEAPGLGSERW
jgi:hypothetical protein